MILLHKAWVGITLAIKYCGQGHIALTLVLSDAEFWATRAQGVGWKKRPPRYLTNMEGVTSLGF